MTHHANKKVRKYVQGYGFLSFGKRLMNNYGKKFMNKGLTAVKKYETKGVAAAKKFNESKYSKTLKKRRIKVFKNIRKKSFTKSCSCSW